MKKEKSKQAKAAEKRRQQKLFERRKIERAMQAKQGMK